MSLKTFHIFFIFTSICLTILFGAWQIRAASQTRSPLDWAAGLLSLGASLALVFYLIWFVRKIKAKNPS